MTKGSTNSVVSGISGRQSYRMSTWGPRVSLEKLKSHGISYDKTLSLYACNREQSMPDNQNVSVIFWNTSLNSALIVFTGRL